MDSRLKDILIGFSIAVILSIIIGNIMVLLLR
jgi:hypothetical protein